jgi:hypothetical protein
MVVNSPVVGRLSTFGTSACCSNSLMTTTYVLGALSVEQISSIWRYIASLAKASFSLHWVADCFPGGRRESHEYDP